MDVTQPMEITKDTLVLMNFGTLSFLGGILLKVVWAWSKADSAQIQLRIDMEREQKAREKDIDAAHAMIRELKAEVKELRGAE